MNKKIISGILAAILVFSAAACQPGDDPEATTTTSAATTQEGSEEETDSEGTEDTDETEEPGATVDTSERVTLAYYLWGDEGPTNQEILGEINAKLEEDINATLEIRYIGWGEVATRYPLLFTAGESFDMSHASPNAPISYFTLAAQGALADLTDQLDIVPALRDEIPEEVWATTRYEGKIYGVPTLYSEYTPTGFVYMVDKLEEYDVGPVTDIESLEAYADAAVEAGDLPINGTASEAIDNYHLLVDTTADWIMAPGIPSDQLFLVGESVDNYEEIMHPAFTDEFLDHAKRMKEWSDKGYWQTDILASQVSDKDNFHNGQAVAYMTHMADWTGSYGTVQQQLDGAELDFWTFAEDSGKILRKAGVENSTVINFRSENVERSLMAIEKFMTEEDYYRLIQYGIEGKHYEIVDEMAQQPEGFNPETDGGGFAVWSLRNDRFNIPYKSEDPRRYELIEEWNETALNNPYAGFSFDSNNVSSELSNLANVNSQLGIQLMLGKAPGDVEAAVEDYRNQLNSAGIENLINELKAQLAEFEPIG